MPAVKCSASLGSDSFPSGIETATGENVAKTTVVEPTNAGNASTSSGFESRPEENVPDPVVAEKATGGKVAGNEERASVPDEEESVPDENDARTDEEKEEQDEKEQQTEEIETATREREKETDENDTKTGENEEETDEDDEAPEDSDEVLDESERSPSIEGGVTLTTGKNATHRTLATLNLPKQVGILVTYAQNIVTRMTGNAYFPTPVPALTAVTKAVDALQVAGTAALARTKGAVAIRNEKRTALVELLQQLRGYVQTIADGNKENGTSIIESAGMAVKKPMVRKPRVFGAVPGAVSGSARLVAASAGPRSSYEWEYSTDGGKTWVTQPVTIQAKTTVFGLTPGASVQFRYRAVTAKGGEGDWSQPVTLIIK